MVPAAMVSATQPSTMPTRILRSLSRLCAQIKAQLREEQTTWHCDLSTFDQRYPSTFATVKKPCALNPGVMTWARR